MHFRAASRGAGGRLRAHRDVRSETGRPSNAVKSARVKRLRAGNLFSDAYTGDFMETNLLTGGRNPSQLYHRDRKPLPIRTPAQSQCETRSFRRT